MTQPGYDALAGTYAEMFTVPFVSPFERAAVDAFAEHVAGGSVVDVGCGIGHISAHLVDRGLEVTSVDPSTGMLTQAALAHPALTFGVDDASLATVDLGDVAGVLARYSLIHVKPEDVRRTLHDWASRLRPGAVVLIAGQSSDDPGVHEFDHAVARAWRWHPDAIADALADAGFAEQWRIVSRPTPEHRFPEFHLCAELRSP